MAVTGNIKEKLTSTNQKNQGKIYAPIPKAGAITSPWGPRGGRNHNGIDVGVAVGSPCVAPADGIVRRAGSGTFGLAGIMVHFEFTQKVVDDDGKTVANAGDIIGWGHAQQTPVTVGKVKAGTVVARSGYPSAPHVHFVLLKRGAGGNGVDGNTDPEPLYKFLQKGSGSFQPGSDNGGSTGVGTVGDLSIEDIFAIARTAAISSQFQLPGIMNMATSMMMTGAKSIYNDEPLLPFIQQLAQASLRHFQSLPNGAFFAFYPDYFGAYNHRKPYWEIDDIEIIDGKIQLNDEALATHVFVAGDTMNLDGSVGQEEIIVSQGVVTIFDMFASTLIAQDSQAQKEEGDDQQGQQFERLAGHAKAINFLKRYGIRPHYEEAAFVRNHFFEVFYAFTQFQLLWSRQFMTEFQFTFMPELYPGGIVAFKDHGIQCYIDSVTHSFDYESGFTTSAQLSAPAAHGPNPNQGVSRGMVIPLSDQEVQQIRNDVKKKQKNDKNK